MKKIKQLIAIALAFALTAPTLIIPTSAAITYPYTAHFSSFQAVPYSNQYAVAAVAVQKFLMLFGHSYATELMPRGGADGICGKTTVAMIKKFQRQECVHGGNEESHSNYGKVDTATWLAIGANIEQTELIDTVGTFFHRFNRSYYDLDEYVMVYNGTGYLAYNHNGNITSAYFYRV